MTRDAFLRRLRAYARNAELGAVTVDTRRGKGSHVTVRIGERATIVQSGELTPLIVKRLCEQLGIDPAAL